MSAQDNLSQKQFKTTSYKANVYDDDDNPTLTTIKKITMHVGGQPVGHVKYAPIEDESHIQWLETAPEHRGKGYAKEIMNEVYKRTPGVVNWSKTMHPASEHLAKQFKDIHPEKTEYEDNQESNPQIARYRAGL